MLSVATVAYARTRLLYLTSLCVSYYGLAQAAGAPLSRQSQGCMSAYSCRVGHHVKWLCERLRLSKSCLALQDNCRIADTCYMNP